MDPIQVVVKHQGKRYDVELDPTSNGETFKYQLYSLTGVEPERQKILIKGGQMKDDTDLGKLGVKPGHAFMMMGTPAAGSAALERPKEKIKFLEDMTEAEAAQSEGAIPAGLQNLGNTCYMNATLQTLRAIPELQEQLATYKPGASTGPDLRQFTLGGSSSAASLDLIASLRDLFKQLSETQVGFPPLVFLSALRSAYPQFAQKSKDGHGYAQQDAEEAWSQIVSQLKEKVTISGLTDGSDAGSKAAQSWVDTYMSGQFESTMECSEPAAKDGGEESVHSQDRFYKLNCHINADTNHLRDGLAAGLTEQIEKRSEVLGRDAVYNKTSRVMRLPKYLTVHFVRFDWRRTTGKKAKIMRKVTFQHELDAVEYCTDDLKKLLIPVRDKIREIRKEEEDVERSRKRRKRTKEGEEPDTLPEGSATKPSQDAKKDTKKDAKKDAKKDKVASEDTEMTDVQYKSDAEFEAEKAASILNAKKELLALVDEKLIADEGGNHTGLYELRGVVTHQGASADSGHYTAFVKKAGRKDPATGKTQEEDGNWWWFNDDKVSEVDAEKIETLSGGGQSHSALILLYRAVPLPSVSEETGAAPAEAK
ncbi:cysteine proteinase [Eremomyces bilateralis CBS 781.70]|uniref:Ubiquitin carboxyl-terminal hydrolase n=1 Tax=Eremomyces bilateralis CBS 781.70 TaxID=1392243 RepID=A0A6G1FSR1_9PEZI|nr:cysteine proteinase [Eremomyces bilateralis CBS 781.70]KAF1808776.1 cysteine proteinase [Eremomyces bilateralis CBS 781.70]